MFLFSINVSCEGNKDRLCKTMQKIFHYKRHNKRLPRGNKHKPYGNIHSHERSLKSFFDFDVHVNREGRAMDVFCNGCHLENPAEKENSNHFGLLALICQVSSSAAYASCYHAVW